MARMARMAMGIDWVMVRRIRHRRCEGGRARRLAPSTHGAAGTHNPSRPPGSGWVWAVKVQQLGAPIFRLEPADTARSYDSFTDTDFDSLADSSLDTPPTSSGAETPTSSASSSSSFSPGPCPATAETPGACAVASLQT